MKATVAARLESDMFPCEHLEVRAVRGHEEISRLFDFQIELVAKKREGGSSVLDPDDIAGCRARLVFTDEEGVVLRSLFGYIASAEEHADDETILFPVYRLRFVPRAWKLGLTKTQEIFMNMSVVEIIERKIALNGLPEYTELRTVEEYPPREFLVQYKETDLELVSRLSEHLGIAFHFEHDGDESERLVLSDQNGGFPEWGNAPVPWTPRGDDRGVFALSTKSEVVPRAYAVQDYNYRTPAVDLSGFMKLEKGTAGGVVEYAPHLKTTGEAEALAKVRAEEMQSQRRVHRGESSLPTLGAGMRITLDGHPRLEDTPLLITRVDHELTQATGGEDAGNFTYQNRFTAIPADVRFRPARTTARPRINGVVSGIVQPGPGGEMGGSARLDEQGRYTVQFHFDTAGIGEEKASRPIRMAQPFAGHDEGLHFPLKPGTEVLLTFVDGDPDRPLIVGALPNPETPSPVTAANADVNQIKTSTGVIFEFGRGR
jgi:type VI secretion system secreted protein VgrG